MTVSKQSTKRANVAARF